MTQFEFDTGYKLLIRYMKEIGRYNDFINISAQKKPTYKKRLFNNFIQYKGNWKDFFNYTHYVGTNYRLYNDSCLATLRDGWIKFLLEQNYFKNEI